MNSVFRNALAMAGLAIATQAIAQVTFYEGEGFEGRSFTTQQRIGSFERKGFNDGASSAVVASDRWEVCEDNWYHGQCIVLRPGRYPSLAAMGLDNQISSVRTVSRNARIDENRYAPDPRYVPAPLADNNYRRHNNEQLYEAQVTSVHAVVGPPEQRCWVEQEQVPQERKTNVGGAIAGAVIGGILGHQVGAGHGKDVATVGGAVAGAAIGANAGRDNGQQATTQDVQHCASTPSQARPEFWDVTYNFRGQEHRIQLAAPPGPTVTVNEQGEPRE